MARGSLLLVTLPPYRGGVPAKAAILARHLRGLGWEVTVAFYATLSDHPDLVVPSWRLGSGARPAILETTCWDGFPAQAVGCRCPELEAPYTRPSAAWRRLIAAHDRHIAVGGTPLIANLLAGSGRPHLLWCAAQVDDDRGARVAAMSWPRRLFDRLVVRPGLLAQQRRVLGSADCTVTGVSRYTCRVLAGIGAARPRWLPIPTDLQRFSPPDRPAPVGVVGFAARLGDPRKRVPLLLEAMARLGASARLRLAGEVPDELPPLAARLGLSDRVEFLDHIPESALPDFYRSLDVFALPSSQEGLGIVGVEAMACGVPVVAAARGFGPDDYIVEGVTGRFTAADPAALAEGLGAIIADRPGRNAMAAAARRRAEEMYGHDAFARGLAEAWYETWGDAP